MTELEKLRAQVWATAAMKATDLVGVAGAGEYADAFTAEFDKRFKPAPCAHIFHSPSRNCAKCGEAMSPAIEAQAYGYQCARTGSDPFRLSCTCPPGTCALSELESPGKL